MLKQSTKCSSGYQKPVNCDRALHWEPKCHPPLSQGCTAHVLCLENQPPVLLVLRGTLIQLSLKLVWDIG